MEKQKNIAELQEKFTVPVPTHVAKIVDERDRKILADAYLKLFSGFSWVNWTNGYSLGRAWQTALTQCETFIRTKKAKNPAQTHLRNVYNSHKKYWSRVIMTHRNSENKIAGTEEWVLQMRAYGMQLIREAMDKINMVLARYNERVEELYIEQMMAHESVVQQTETNTATVGGVVQAGNAIQSENTVAENANQAMSQTTKQTTNQAQSGAPITQPHELAIPVQQEAQQSAKKQQVQPEMKAVSAKQAALKHATEKLAQPQFAHAEKKNETQQQVAQRPQTSGLVQHNTRPTPRVMNVEKLQQSVAHSAARKPRVEIPQVRSAQATQMTQQQVAQRPQMSGLVQHNTRPMPRVMNVEKLQQGVNKVIKTPHRPNMNMLFFKNFNQRIV